MLVSEQGDNGIPPRLICNEISNQTGYPAVEKDENG